MSDIQYYNNTYTDGFFNVSEQNGFLPIKDPLARLPDTYNQLQNLIDDLHVFQNNKDQDNKDQASKDQASKDQASKDQASKDQANNQEKKLGILSIPNEIESRVKSIPNYLVEINKETDVFVLQALYRAYTFITSGYTLELSYQEFKKSGNYGVARQLLPSNISEPLILTSTKLDVYPWLDYHYAYSLGNYVRKDPNSNLGLHWKNLDMGCKFTGSDDEIGFIMVHVYINELTPKLVGSVMNYGRNKNRDKIFWLKQCADTMEQINSRRREMWSASKPANYNDFRIFIMGIKGNDNIFGAGLVYDKCFGNKPQKFRGQTGAQDSIIPMIDIFCGIVDFYPENKLTEYLMDLRTYRPTCIQQFFKDLRDYYVQNPIFKQLVGESDYVAMIYLLKIVDEVYLFRNGHWQFVQKYIMSNTKYAFATGGTPITTWLINQIDSVLECQRVIIDYLKENYDKVNTGNNTGNNTATNIGESSNNIEESVNNLWINLRDGYDAKKQLVLDQKKELDKCNYDINLVYEANIKLKLADNK